MNNKIKTILVLGSLVLGLFAGTVNIAKAQTVVENCDSARIYGNVYTSGTTIYAWFEWGKSSTGLVNRTPRQTFSSNSQISALVTGLSENTGYSYELITSDGNIEKRGGIRNFSTPSCALPDPSVTIYATPTTVPYNTTSTITWKAKDAEYCIQSDGTSGWGGRVGTNGSFPTGKLTSTSRYTITCYNSAGQSDTKSTTVIVEREVIQSISVMISADNSNLPYNGSTTINWETSKNVTSCTGTGGANGWAGTKSIYGGNFYTGKLLKNTTFGITCYGPNNQSVNDSVNITVEGEVIEEDEATGNLSVSSSSCLIGLNDSTCRVNVSWTTKNADNVSLVDRNTGNVLSREKYLSMSVYVAYPYTNFDLKNNSITLDTKKVSASCENDLFWNGSICARETTQNLSVNISANPTSIYSGNSSVITWSSNGSYCTATGGTSGWSGSKGTYGTFPTGNIYNTTTFNIICYNNQGQSDNASVTVYVNGTNDYDEAPRVDTRTPTDVEDDRATLRGYVSSNGGSNTRAWFEWGTSSGSYSNRTSSVSYGSTSGSYFEQTIRGLDSDRIYYYRAVAENSYGETVYGSRESFRTEDDDYDDDEDDDKPDVTTYSATSVTDTRAVLNGYVDPNGSSTSTWFEWGTSYSNLNRTTSKDSQGTRRDEFEESISGLSPNTIYYFRAMARNSEGTSRGSIMSFVTSGNGYIIPPTDTCAYGNCAPNVITTLASNISQSSARINGIATITGNVYTTGYFEYGVTPSLGLTTSQRSVGTASSIPFSENLSNLAPNTLYYFRAVATNQYGTTRGSTLTFRTGSLITYTDTVTNTNTVYRNTRIVTNTNTQVGNSRPSLVMLTVSGNEDRIRRGDILDYIVSYENISEKDLRNVVLRVGIPGEFEFLESTRGSYSNKDRVVVINVGDLDPGENDSVRITVSVDANSEIGKTVVIPANLAYTIVENDEQEEVFAYSENTITEERLGLGASAIFGMGFLPNTLLGWLLLILLILLLVATVRWLYDRSGRAQTPPASPAH